MPALDPADPRPAYQQIAGQLRASIGRNELRPGDQLPSERVLAAEYGVTPVTVRQGIALLKAEGLVDMRRGRGLFVRRARPMIGVSAAYVLRGAGGQRRSWVSEAGRQGTTGQEVLVGVAREPVPGELASRLGVEAGAMVVVRRRLMLLASEPAQLVDSYYPSDLARGTAIERNAKIRGGALAALEAHGVRVARFSEEVGARMPRPGERTALRLGSGVPVLTVLRTIHDDVGHGVEVTSMVMAADRHVLLYDIPG
jgi:GntR family transcriptional regulator